jgi:hypothetical protein
MIRASRNSAKTNQSEADNLVGADRTVCITIRRRVLDKILRRTKAAEYFAGRGAAEADVFNREWAR